LATLLTFAVAATSWKLLESPLNSLKDRIGTGLPVKPPTAVLEESAGGI
jgi:peptidoglycan/LPS O-acetylase OafA/YrhL